VRLEHHADLPVFQQRRLNERIDQVGIGIAACDAVEVTLGN
jgi:hypothetical protein